MLANRFITTVYSFMSTCWRVHKVLLGSQTNKFLFDLRANSLRVFSSRLLIQSVWWLRICTLLIFAFLFFILSLFRSSIHCDSSIELHTCVVCIQGVKHYYLKLQRLTHELKKLKWIHLFRSIDSEYEHENYHVALFGLRQRELRRTVCSHPLVISVFQYRFTPCVYRTSETLSHSM